MALVVALVALATALAAAVARSRWLPESLIAAAGAALLVAIGAIGTAAARHAIGALAPTVGFLAALLVLAEGCRRQGVFAWIGEWLGPDLCRVAGDAAVATRAARAGRRCAAR